MLWALLSFPQPREGGKTALDSSIAGRLADGLEKVVRADRLQP